MLDTIVLSLIHLLKKIYFNAAKVVRTTIVNTGLCGVNKLTEGVFIAAITQVMT